MRFPLSWLQELVEVPAELDKVSALLMRAGAGLEAVEKPGAALQHVVVAKVLSRDPHPNADKLSVCKVSDGQKDYRVVCGAQNYQVGSVVPLAKEGAVLPGDFKIKRSKIRGEESEGMLCAAQELGLAEKSEGLMLLDASLPLGTPLAQALGLDDVILTLETTANRPDHLSLLGLAREIAALGGLGFKEPKVSLPAAGPEAGFKVSVSDVEGCPYYSARVIEGVQVKASPAWLSQRLERSGIRSINNVVDATNYVLLEHGQPMHAFDLGALKGGLEARLARSGEKLVTLDGQERLLKEEDLVIADAQGPQALAGVMGGAASQVSEGTTSLVLEAAVFLPKRIRRASRRLGLASESSHRFERGVNPHGVDTAMDRCAALILELAGGKLKGGRVSAGSPGPLPAPLLLDAARVNALLGTSLSAEAMAGLLKQRGFAVRAQGSDFEASPPAWRPDLGHAVDLAEEVLQMAGLDSLKGTDLQQLRTPDADDNAWQNTWLLRRQLERLGLAEASTLSYLDPRLAALWQLKDAWRLDNPLSEEQSLLRPSLLPNLVEAGLGALKRRQGGVAFFELGRSFGRGPKGLEEAERIAVFIAGAPSQGQWNAPEKLWDYFDLKGMAESLAKGLQVSFRCAQAQGPDVPAWAHPGQCAKLSIGGLAGVIAALHPALLKALDAPKHLGAAFAMELEILAPAKRIAKEARYEAFSRIPTVERDLSCLMESGLEAGKVIDFIRKEGGMGEARVLDLFEGQPLPQGKKSLTFRVTYAAEGRSLTDAEVNAAHAQLVQRLQTALPLEVRG